MNENDVKLLEFCKGRPKSIREIAQHLNIAVKNVIVRLPKLEKDNLISVNKNVFLKKRMVSTLENDKTLIEVLNILRTLKEKGELTSDEFAISFIPPFPPFIDEQTYHLKNEAYSQVLYSNLVKRKVVLSEEGEKFLKQHEKEDIKGQ